MKRAIAVLVALFCINLVAADECGMPPASIRALLPVSDEVIQACDNVLAQHYLAINDNEMATLTRYVEHLEAKLRAVAVKATRLYVDCGVETMRNMATVVACRQLSTQRSAVTSRLDRLAQWKKAFESRMASGVPLNLASDVPPCASSAEFSALHDMKDFDQATYDYWSRCRSE